MANTDQQLSSALWRLYRRPERPVAWALGDGNLPWNEPAFAQRMLREHLDESHGAASRVTVERRAQLGWLTEKLGLGEGTAVLDVTCGPVLYAVALAGQGCQVTGIDFSPAAIAYARRQAAAAGLVEQCVFIEQDVRQMAPAAAAYDAALFLYGQLAVFPRDEARALLARIAAALQPGGRLVIELLNQEKVDKADSSWWFTDERGLWGDRPFLHLGERFWLAEEKISVERFHIIELETGKLEEIVLCDQTYAVAEMVGLLREVGFTAVDVYPAWDGLPLYDAGEWIVYVAHGADR